MTFSLLQERVIQLLQRSQDSSYSHARTTAIVAQFEIDALDKTQLNLLFAPAGPIQEISIDNGWGAEFIKLANEVDKITGNK